MVKEKQSFFDKIIKGSPSPKNTVGVKNETVSSKTREIEIDKGVPEGPEEGQLSVDVYETDSAIVTISIIGGLGGEDVNISVDNNVLTISGVREKSVETEEHNYLVNECFWGSFSRSIILPVEVDVDKVKATMKNGVLKVYLPKLSGNRSKKIKIEKE